MPSLIGNYIGSNYLITTPTSKFGTRELAVVVVELTGVESNYQDANSLFTRTVRAIQQNAEVYTVFPPANARLTLLVAADTQPQDDGDEAGDGNRNNYFDDILTAAGITGHSVWNAVLTGSSINYD